MKNILKYLKMFMFTSEKDMEYRYLSESVDIADLERRMRDIENQRAPFQKPYFQPYF